MSNNDLTFRSLLTAIWNNYFGQTKIWDALKYKPEDTLDFSDFYRIYKRGDLGANLVKIPAEYTWRSRPHLREDDNTKNVFNNVADRLGLFNYLERVDRISGIGRYGVLLIGVNDGKDLKEPITKGSIQDPEDIIYLSPYKENNVSISSFEEGTNNPRFGLPKEYQITFLNHANRKSYGKVHWSRVLHIADNKDEDEVYGIPRLKDVYNRLVDLEKIAGCSAEGFKRMVTDKILFDLDENVSLTPSEEEDFQDQIDQLVDGFRDYVRTRGVDPKQLKTNMESPKDAFDVTINLICAAKGYPRKFILGSERGEITSSMDIFTFFDSMQVRRVKYAERDILKRLMDRFAYFGLIEPQNKYTWDWDPLYELSPKEKADIAYKIGATIKVLGTSEALGIITDSEEIREKILGWEGASDGLSEPIVKYIKNTHKDLYDKINKIAEDAEVSKEELITNIGKMESKFDKIVRY